jgi:ABC-type proline/glycine betaine transport system permease subunit
MNLSTDLYHMVLFLFLRRLLGYYNGCVNTYIFASYKIVRYTYVGIILLSLDVIEIYKEICIFIGRTFRIIMIAELWRSGSSCNDSEYSH